MSPQNHDILTTLPRYLSSSFEEEDLVLAVLFVWGVKEVEGKRTAFIVFVDVVYVDCGGDEVEGGCCLGYY